VATAKLALVHVPPAGVELSVVVSPTHKASEPVNVVGCGLTVTTVVLKHVPTEYDIVAVPPVTPVTNPVPDPTVAIAVLLLLQDPPAVVFVSVVVAPAHNTPVPAMSAKELIVIE
jgi:hypothetical protein